MLLSCSTVLISYGQDEIKDPKKDTWEQEKKNLKYQRKEGYKGPEDWQSGEPTDIRDEYHQLSEEELRRLYGTSRSVRKSSNSGTIQYRPQQVKQQRRKNYQGFDRGGGNGTLKYDPKVKRPKPIEPPKRKIQRKSRSSSSPWSSSSSRKRGEGISSGFWQTLLIVLVVIAAVMLLYFFLRKKKPADTKVLVDVEDDWNPEVVSKTELELKLEAAMAREDFRECVRIYFTFILKELIKKEWIRWKKEKTNHHYVMEMGGRDGSLRFMECVRIYDLVWYGDYHIDRDIFEMLQPTLLNYYKSLDPTDD